MHILSVYLRKLAALVSCMSHKAVHAWTAQLCSLTYNNAQQHGLLTAYATFDVLVAQEQQQEAIALDKAGRVICNVKLAAAWRGWLAVVQHRRYLKEKLGSALNLFTNRRLTLAWQAWQVSLFCACV